ncbi:MAG: hypothetical protein WBQ55_15175 [Xanthobacteraceae bacterium]
MTAQIHNKATGIEVLRYVRFVATREIDHEITDKAIGFFDGNDVEVWSLGRLVVWLPHNSSE